MSLLRDTIKAGLKNRLREVISAGRARTAAAIEAGAAKVEAKRAAEAAKLAAKPAAKRASKPSLAVRRPKPKPQPELQLKPEQSVGRLALPAPTPELALDPAQSVGRLALPAPDPDRVPLEDPVLEAARIARVGAKPKGGQWLPDTAEKVGVLGMFHSPEEIVRRTLGDADTRAFYEASSPGVADWFNKAATRYLKSDFGTAADPLKQLYLSGRSHLGPFKPIDPKDIEDTAENYWADLVDENLMQPKIGNLVTPPHSTEITEAINRAHAFDKRAAARNVGYLGGPKARTNWSGTIDPMEEVRNSLLTAVPRLGDPRAVPVHTPLYMLGEKADKALQLNDLLQSTVQATRPDTSLLAHINDAMPLHIPRDVRGRVTSNIEELGVPPPEVAIDPKSLPRMTLPQVSERVARFERWRDEEAKRRVRAALRTEYAPDINNAAVQDLKVYPGDKRGMRWAQIREPDEIPEGWERSSGGNYWRAPDGDVGIEGPHDLTVERALGAEGAFMDHCVGGYCSDVLSKNRNIYSLRDAEGMPHVTIETGLGRPFDLTEQADVDPQLGDLFNQYYYGPDSPFERAVRGHPNENAPGPAGFANWVKETAPDVAARYPEAYEMPLPQIMQIKGIRNHAPLEDVRPYIHDFLSTQGPWDYGSNQYDLGNIGRTLLPDQRLITPEQWEEGLGRYAQNYHADVPEGPERDLAVENTLANIREYNPRETKEYWPWLQPHFEGYARGGHVKAHKAGCGCASCDGLSVQRRAA